MIEVLNPAKTRDGAAPRETPTVAGAADVIMARATAEIKGCAQDFWIFAHACCP